ncbi:beta-propeller domain-containing protein [Nitrososphaera sp.]|uniref:beta-propeller domain-containing protein n=1 Tax=Nitrososphaera sp. TaxID=1971748 RepID=UPI00307F3A82
MARFSMYGMAGIGIAAAIGFVLVLSSISTNIPVTEVTRIVDEGTLQQSGGQTQAALTVASSQKLIKFTSLDEIRAFLVNVESNRGALMSNFGGGMTKLQSGQWSPSASTTYGPEIAAAPPAIQLTVTDADRNADTSMASGAAAGSTFSTTNVQVAGVDEPDFMKNDGKYAYVLSGDKLTIAEVYPAESAKVVAKVGLDIQQGQYLQNMFLNNNTLAVMYQEYGQDNIIPQYEVAPQPVYVPKTHVIVLDISDREDPKLLNDYTLTGAYNNARMIGHYVYVVTTSDLYSYYQPLLPKIAWAGSALVPDVYYFENPEPYYNFNTVASIDILAAGKDGGGAVNSKTFMMNPASTLYVSEKSIYIAYQKYQPYHYYSQASRERFFEVVVPLLPQEAQMRIKTIDADQSLSDSQKWDRMAAALQDMYNMMSEQEKAQFIEKVQKALADYDAKIQKDAMRTVVHKIAIGENGQLDYVAKGEVPGRLLNQFSMDEKGDRFRVATTVEYYSPSSQGLYSNVYVLDSQMNTVGRLEQIEPGESIYSTRFIGDRLYMVTFQRIDPFFVIDLSTDQPRILGALKLPGYSTYLHPYDENHIIGLGKDTKDNGYGGVIATGVKVALFDVSNVSSPRLVDSYTIEGSGTASEAIYDHKAFFFDKNRNVLSIPVTSYDAEPKHDAEGRYIQPKTWRGFYVLDVNESRGVELKGKIEHPAAGGQGGGDGVYYYGPQGTGRSFFIDGVLYTVTQNNLIKMNDIQTLQELNKLEIGSTGGIIKYPEPLREEAG